MYGMVNKSVESMVRANCGDAVWETIKERAGVTTISFISTEPYDDNITYKLVGAASDILGKPPEEILETFGDHWVNNTAMSSHPDLMALTGRSLPEFLSNLNNMHVRVRMVFPNLRPPRFEVTDVGPSSLRLHYYSHRDGLAHFAIGLVKGLGRLFSTPATVVQVEWRAKGADHDEFDVHWSAV